MTKDHEREALLARLGSHGLPRRALTAAERRLAQTLLREGEVVLKNGRYVPKERPELVRGRLEVTRRGRAFLLQEGQDLEIVRGGKGGGLHGDTVLARPMAGGRAEVVEVLERARDEVVGTVVVEDGRLKLRPREERLPRFYVSGEANPGDVVVLAVEDFGEEGVRPPSGRVVTVLGPAGAPGVDVAAIVAQYGLAASFPPDVAAEAARLPAAVAAADLAGRLDLRAEEIFTIDGKDAKDLDDAVSLVPHEEGFTLGVHIADVGHYAPEGSPMEREAYRRGTSVYLVDRVLPMFPPELSNGLASLHPGVERLTLSVFLEFDGAGERRSFRIAPSVIHSKGRLTYEGVNAYLAGEAGDGSEEAARFGATLEAMVRLSDLLRQRRQARGAIDFDLPEDRVLLGENGEPLAIVRRTRGVAERLIEEFMLAANEAVATFAAERGLPILYRVHEPPPADKVEAFRRLCALLGVRFTRAKEPPPKAFQELLARVAGTPEERLLGMVALRTMARARYWPENLGHYGLAASHYTHFTSPIRRYPDLLLQRVVKEDLAGALTPERRQALEAFLPEAAMETSRLERVAEAAERESVQLKKVAYLADKVGEVYDGIVTGVTNFGLFVELSIGVEGLVPVASLTDDYYRLDEALFTLRGARTRRAFRLGQEVRVEVARVDVEARMVDLTLVERAEARRRRRKKAPAEGTAPAKGAKPGAEPSGFDAERKRRYNKKKRHR